MNIQTGSLLTFLFLLLLGCATNSKERSSIKDALVTYAYEDIDAAIDYYHLLKRESPTAYNFEDEWELNALGYQLINDGRTGDAIKIFKLLVSEFPDSFNPYDSLGEAYYLNGDEESALKSYRTSLRLNPENENAELFIINSKYRNRDKNKFYKVYPKDQYVDDLDVLAKTLTTVNPQPYKYMPEAAFWRVVEEKKRLITDSTTYAAFIWHCSELVANINCGHSHIPMYLRQETEMLPDELRFPLELFNQNGKLYVFDGLVNRDKIPTGAEVLAVNGKSSAEIIEEINKHFSTQGKVGNSTKRHSFNSHSSVLIPYALGFPKSYDVVVEGKKGTVALSMLKAYDYQWKDMSTCRETFCLKFVGDEEDTALLTIRHWDFYGGRFSILRDFLDQSFATIRAQETQHLIVDVRGNGGGNSDGAAHLLRYLIDSSFTYFADAPANSRKLNPLAPHADGFEGNVYFLTDGRAGSTTGQLLALAKHHGIGTIVGEESNGGIFYTGGQRIFQLPNTELFYLVGRYIHVTNASSVSDERGVLPHHYSVLTVEDYLTDTDGPLAYTLRLIKKQ